MANLIDLKVWRAIGNLFPGLSSFVIDHSWDQTLESLLLIGKQGNIRKGKCCKCAAQCGGLSCNIKQSVFLDIMFFMFLVTRFC